MSASVAVVGGGPAGSALALRLAQLGHDVVLFERRPPAARGFAESLAPGVLVHLRTLGIDVPPGRLCTSKLVRWHSSDVERVAIESLIVDRESFNAHLLDAAVAAGVRVVREAFVGTPAFLADATGHAGLLRRPRRPTAPRTFALRARWDGIDAPPEMRICTLPRGWMWGVRGPDDAYHVAAFADRPGELPQSDFFPFLDRPPDASHVCDATPFVCNDPITRDSIVVGDAACALDPLSSSGIQAALGGAIAASIAVNTILTRPSDADVAIRFYADHVARTSARHQQWSRAFYSDPPSPRPRAPFPEPDTVLTLHPGAAIVDAPIVLGNLVALRPVLRTPAGETVAFLGPIELAPLIEPLRDGITAAQLADSWPLDSTTASKVMTWLVDNQVISS